MQKSKAISEAFGIVLSRIKKLENEKEVLLQLTKSQEIERKKYDSEEERINQLEEELKYQNKINGELNRLVEKLQEELFEIKRRSSNTDVRIN